VTVKVKSLHLGDKVQMEDGSFEKVIYIKHLTSKVIQLGFKEFSVVIGTQDLVEVSK
jgi:hypothetical protein